MKKLLLLSLAFVLLSSAAPMPYADITDVVNGQEITLDGTTQRIKLRRTETLKALVSTYGGALPLYLTPLGNGGAYFGNGGIDTNVNSLIPKNEHFIISCYPSQEDLYVKGTNTEKVRVSY